MLSIQTNILLFLGCYTLIAVQGFSKNGEIILNWFYMFFFVCFFINFSFYILDQSSCSENVKVEISTAYTVIKIIIHLARYIYNWGWGNIWGFEFAAKNK